MGEPLVSFVTPVYNGAQYLAAAIESALRQTYGHWEYVVLDNCSTDGTGELARGYAERDARIRVVTNDEFLPQLANMNRSMTLMSPESVYTKVIHADDWLYPECVERMVAVAEAHPNVGVVSSYRLVGDVVEPDRFEFEHTVVPGREIAAYHVAGGGAWLIGTPSTLLIRSSIVRGQQPFYDSRYLISDSFAVYTALERGDFAFVPEVLSYTRMHDASTTTRSGRIGAWNAETTAMTAEYGMRYLDADRYVRRVKELERRLYWLQVKFAVRGRLLDREVLEYQRDRMSAIEEPLAREGVRGRWIARKLARGLLALPWPARERRPRPPWHTRVAGAVFRVHK